MINRIMRMPCAEVLAGQEVRNAAINYYKDRMYDVGKDWTKHLYQSSVALLSPCGRKVVKVDSSKICTVDTKVGSEWKTMKFTCKTIEEAWRTAAQTVKAFDAQRSKDAIH